MATKSTSRIRVRRVSTADELRRYQRLVSKFEGRYECSSEAALSAVRAGLMKETADVAKWLSAFKILGHLKEIEQAGDATGSPTKTT
jgi:hypothetical protein